ncbi:MAG: DUF4129 domain-containing protein [Anaerolineales bacterium]|nr:DUF4129 domain-containing protein [Anaerolineales bacterium]
MMKPDAWIKDVFRPLALAVMAGCVAWSIAELIKLLFPFWNSVWTTAVCVLATLEAHISYRLLTRQPAFMTNRWRLRLLEMAFLFVVVKAGYAFSVPWEIFMADLRALPADPSRLLEPITVVNFLLAVFTLFIVNDMLVDLDELSDPELVLAPISARDRIAERFFYAGLILMVASGLARIGFAELFSLGRVMVAGLIINALLYFAVGLLVLGQANYARLTALWQGEGTPVAGQLGSRWARHSFWFLALVAALAFSLPTFYSTGLLGLINAAFTFVLTVLYFFAALVSFAIVSLLSLFFPAGTDISPQVNRPPPIPPTPEPAPSPAEPLPLDPSLELLRNVGFWAVIILIVGYILIAYLRERPEILQAVKNLRLFKILKQFWETLTQNFNSLASAARQALAETWQNFRRAPLPPLPFFNLRRASTRDQIFYYYLSALRRAEQLGAGRRPAQTPDEYEPELEQTVEEARAEALALTEAFDRARYSPTPVDTAQASAARRAWEAVRRALGKAKQKQ